MEERISSKRGLIFILLMCFSYIYIIESKPAEQTMLDVMNVCPDVKFVNSSTYFSKCAEVSKPKSLKDDNNVGNICMMLHDVLNRICEYNVQITSKNDKLKLPDTGKAFDEYVKKLEPRINENKGFIDTVCKDISSLFKNLDDSDIDNNAELIQYVKYVKENLFSQEECKYTCHGHKNSVNPFCMILLWANEMFNLMKSTKDLVRIDEKLSNNKKLLPVIDTVVDKKKLIVEKTNKVAENNKLAKSDNKNEEQAVMTDKDSVKLQPEQNLPSNGPKKSEDPKIKAVDIPSAHDEVKPNVESQSHKAEIQVKEDANLPLPSNNEKTNIQASKPQENIESPNVVQPEDRNPDELNFSDDRSNNKGNENEADEGIEHENVNDGKESAANLDESEFPIGNPGEPHDPISVDGKKFYLHSVVKEEEESHFFTYFSVISLLCVGLYIGYHNRQKILAMFLEGRRSRRGRGSRRRPSTASYRKLDSNLEEAVTSQCNSNVTHVIY